MEGWPAKRGVRESLADLEKKFPRFWWKDIYPGGRFDCKGNDEKFNIIAESIRVANDMLQDGEREFYDAAFNRFFVSPGKADSGWGYHNWYPRWNALQYYMSALKKLMTTAPKYANRGQSRYITLSCRPFTKPVCAPEYPGQNKGAVYQHGAYAPDEKVLESITFCDGYFGLRYTNDVIKDRPPPKVSDLGNSDIDTFERVIIHEITHAWRSLGTWDGRGGLGITDPVNQHMDPPKPVYGAKRTQVWAWLFMDPNERPRPLYPGTNINRDTPYTAECYAWMYQNRFFIKALGWDDDGSPGSWSAKIDDSIAVDSVDLQVTDDPAGDGSDDFIPPFCHSDGTDNHGTPLVSCDFINQPFDEWLLDQGYACNCNESGCDRTSPSCCASGSCPTCSCNESGCSDDSPACCASGTCKWGSSSSLGATAGAAAGAASGLLNGLVGNLHSS